MTMFSCVNRIRVIRAAALLVAVTALGGVALPASGAVSDPLVISHDGVTFTPGSDISLFTEAGRIVPGDEATERVWLRNDAPDPGLLRIDLVNVRADDADLAEATGLTFIDASGEILGRLTIEQALQSGTCVLVRNDLLLEPGETLQLDVGVTVDAGLGSAPGDDGRDGTLGSVGFQLRSTLSDAAAGPSDGSACPPPDSPFPPTDPDGPPDDGALPATGAEINAAALTVSAGLLLAGAFLALRTRRRRNPQ